MAAYMVALSLHNWISECSHKTILNGQMRTLTTLKYATQKFALRSVHAEPFICYIFAGAGANRSL